MRVSRVSPPYVFFLLNNLFHTLLHHTSEAKSAVGDVIYILVCLHLAGLHSVWTLNELDQNTKKTQLQV